MLGVGTLTFPPGATHVPILVHIIDDEVAEPTEFFRISLLPGPGEGFSLAASLVTINIEDNDGT